MEHRTRNKSTSQIITSDMTNQLLQIQATMSKGITMSHKSLRLTFDSQENLTDEQIGKIMGWYEKMGWLSFSTAMVRAEDLLALPEVKTDERKSPSQRLRSVLYVLFEQQGQKGEFQDYYRTQIEKIIDHLKSKLV